MVIYIKAFHCRALRDGLPVFQSFLLLHAAHGLKSTQMSLLGQVYCVRVPHTYDLKGDDILKAWHPSPFHEVPPFYWMADCIASHPLVEVQESIEKTFQIISRRP